MVVYLNMLSENVPAAGKSLLPIRIAKHKNGVRSRRFSLCGKDQPAEHGLDAERREIIAGNASDDAVITPIISGYAAKSKTVRDDVAKGNGLIVKIHKVRVGELLERVIASLLQSKDGELLGVGHGQRPEEEAVNDAENGSVDGDAERESNDCDGGKPRRLEKSAKRKT
jgi:hypothetical protein